MVYNIETLSQKDLLCLLIHIHDKYAIDAIDVIRVKEELIQFKPVKKHNLIIQDIVSRGYSSEEILTTLNNIAAKKATKRQETDLLKDGEKIMSDNIYDRDSINHFNKLKINMDEYLQKADKGKPHHKWVHNGYRVGMYNLDGELEMEFDDLTDAVAKNPVSATYKGILACVKGEIKKHKGKIWRKQSVAMYNFSGEKEMEFDSLVDAVENNPVGATYKGILACVKGEKKTHMGKVWK